MIKVWPACLCRLLIRFEILNLEEEILLLNQMFQVHERFIIVVYNNVAPYQSVANYDMLKIFLPIPGRPNWTTLALVKDTS